MINSILKYNIIYLCVLFIFASCMNDEEWARRHNQDKQPSTEGVYILCEGNFMYGNASLSFYNTEDNTISNNIFSETNGIPLGDVAHSITLYDTLAFLVINNSGKIYVMNTNNSQYVGKITGLTSPRYIEIINDHKAYVSDLYGKGITIIDPLGSHFEQTRVAQGTILGKINLINSASPYYQHPTEQLIQVDNKLYTNCWSYDNQIMVIDITTDTVIDSIEVGKQPASMVLDKNKQLWVLCDGSYAGSPYGQEPASIFKISTTTHEARKVFEMNESNGNKDFAADLAINSTLDTIYFVSNGIWRFAIDNPQKELFVESKGELFHSIAVDPLTSEVYVSNAIDYLQRGVVYRLTPQAVPIDTFRVGINPGAFAFKKKQ